MSYAITVLIGFAVYLCTPIYRRELTKSLLAITGGSTPRATCFLFPILDDCVFALQTWLWLSYYPDAALWNVNPALICFTATSATSLVPMNMVLVVSVRKALGF